MVERDLYAPMIKGANSEGWLLYHIADGTYGKNPFDIGGFTPQGIGCAIEVKKVENDFPQYEDELLKLMEVHQIAWLREAKKRGACALIPIYSIRKREFRVYYSLNSENIEFTEHYNLTKVSGQWIGWQVR